MSKRNSEKWLLLQSSNGVCSVVSIQSVISPSNDTNVGTVVIVDRGNGSHEAATVVGFSRDRELLERQIYPPAPKCEALPEPDNEDQGEEDIGDYSASGSSWVPSDAEDQASSDDEVAKKKLKLDSFTYRSYSNRRSGRVIKPSHRADAVNEFLESNVNRVNGEIENLNTHTNITDKKFLPDSTRINNSPAPILDPDIVSINLRDIMDMKRQFQELFTLISEIKGSATNVNRAGNNDNSINPAAIKREMYVNNTLNDDNIENYSDVEDRSEGEDLNRSDDNVLITNKYENANDMNNFENSNINNEYENSNNTTQNESANINTQYENANNKRSEIENNKNEYAGNKNRLIRGNTNKKRDLVAKNKHNDINEREWIPIGSGKTLIHKDQYKKVKWKTYSMATRTLLLAVFPRKILATHSLTGRPSPAFRNRPAKMCLDPGIVTDVIHEIVDRFNVKESLVRQMITTKCADECKMWKMQNERRRSQPNPPPRSVRKVCLQNQEVNLTC